MVTKPREILILNQPIKHPTRLAKINPGINFIHAWAVCADDRITASIPHATSENIPPDIKP
jgi:hypothetical protein